MGGKTAVTFSVVNGRACVPGPSHPVAFPTALKSPEHYTAQIAIKALQNNRDIDLGLAMFGSFLATIPLLVVFVFVGRLVAGIMDGAFNG